jgi:excisionase family DNA binding protein
VAASAATISRDDDSPSLSYEILLTPEDIAAVLRIGRTRVYDLINTGVLPSLKIGRLRRVRRIDLDGLILKLIDQHNGRCYRAGEADV